MLRKDMEREIIRMLRRCTMETLDYIRRILESRGPGKVRVNKNRNK